MPDSNTNQIGVNNMNFYIGDSIRDLDISGDNVEFSDELLDFIYNEGKKLSFNTEKLCGINPYADTEIPLLELPQIVEICKHFLNQGLLPKSENYNEWHKIIIELIKYAQEAIFRGSGLIVIGD